MPLAKLEGLQILLLFLPALINIWTIWHAFKHDFPGEFERYLWITLAVFAPLLGGLLYLCFGLGRSRKRE